MNWLLEIYRPWWADKGSDIGAPEAPLRAPSRWVNDFYWPWFEKTGEDQGAPVPPWERPAASPRVVVQVENEE